MVRSWRKLLCARSRLTLALLSVAASWALLVIFSSITLTAVQQYQALRLDKKIEQLKVGMTKTELVQIMGCLSIQ